MADEYKVFSESGCEQYIDMSVVVSEVSCPLPVSDRKGRRELNRHVAGVSFICKKGTMTARWKGEADRDRCKAERLKNRRWHDVETYAADILKGNQLPPGLFLHPSLTGRTDGLLVPIDGARRLMAHLEAGTSEIPVVVIARE